MSGGRGRIVALGNPKDFSENWREGSSGEACSPVRQLAKIFFDKLREAFCRSQLRILALMRLL